MKACKVTITQDVLFNLIGLKPYGYDIAEATCEQVGTFTLTITGTADDIPEVNEGEDIPRKVIAVTRQTASII